MLNSTFSGVSLAVMKRIFSHKGARPTCKSYPNELMIALTLSFYYVKTYNYVRRTFNLAVPHPSTLRLWYKCVNGKPGFTDEAFRALSVRASEARQDQQQIVCALTFHEMAIGKHVEWDGKRFLDYVDIGSEIDNNSTSANSTSAATEALVVMVIGLNDN